MEIGLLADTMASATRVPLELLIVEACEGSLKRFQMFDLKQRTRRKEESNAPSDGVGGDEVKGQDR